jgi:hypothetical protein
MTSICKHILICIENKESKVLDKDKNVDFYRSNCDCGWKSNWSCYRHHAIIMYELHLSEQPEIEYEFEDLDLWIDLYE